MGSGVEVHCAVVKNKFGDVGRFDLWRDGSHAIMEGRLMPEAERASRDRMAAAAAARPSAFAIAQTPLNDPWADDPDEDPFG